MAATSFVFEEGGRPVNKIGGLTSVLLDLLEGIDVQGNADAAFADGSVMHVLVVTSGPLDEDDPAPTVRFGQVLVDVDDPPDPSNNFSGTGQVRLADGQELFVVYEEGSIEGGELVMTGDREMFWGYDLRLDELEAPYRTGGRFGHIKLTIDEDGFTGMSGSLITPAELEADVYPGTAKLLTRAIAEDKPMAAAIKGIYDANFDDVITVQELVENDQQASLAQPDVDHDGDGVNDHLSQGVFIEGVRVELVAP